MSAGMVEIRPFDLAEAQAVSTLFRQLLDEYAAWLCEPADMAEMHTDTSAEAIAERAKTHRTFVAWQGPWPVGIIEVGEAGQVFVLFVRRGGQDGFGIAMALMARAEESCRAAGQPAIAVHSSLNTQAFYERLGFVTSGEPQRAHGLVFVPMEKRL